YLFQKQLRPPTGVEHCVKANLISNDHVNLVVAKTTLLQVYTIRYDRVTTTTSTSNDDNNNNNNNSDDNNQSTSTTTTITTTKPTLELSIEVNLFASIESLNVIRLPDSSCDSIILSFRDAKVSILNYNPETQQLDISSMHFYENRVDLKNGRESFTNPPLIKVDYQQRCAVMLVYDRHIAVLPFRQSFSSILDEDDDDDEQTGGTAANKESYIISLNSLGIENVKDLCFLHGYYEPTILFLHEPSQTWTSRISTKKFTNVLTAVELNISQRQQPVIWSIESMPYNCYRLVAVPEPLGGAVVVTPNIMFYCNQTSRYGLGCNEYANTDTGDSFQFPIDSDSTNLVFTLDCSIFTFLESDRLLGSLKNGELLIFHLASDGRNVQRINITKAGASVLSSSICVLTSNLLFLGSRLGDSLLLQYTEKVIDVESTDNVENLSNPYKKQKSDEVFDMFDDEEQQHLNKKNNNNSKSNTGNNKDKNGDAMEDDDDDDIFNEKKNQLKSYQLNICDHITNIGPISDMITGVSYDSASVSNQESYQQRNLELVSCSGHGKNGALTILQNGVRPELVATFELAGVRQAWAVCVDDPSAPGAQKKRTHDSDVLDNSWHTYLFASLENTTLIFWTGKELKEIPGKIDHATITIGSIFNRKRIVLVYPTGIKLLSGNFNEGVTSFTPFHNVNCAHGFVYFTEKGVFRINQLSKQMNYENEWAIRKIALRMTCHKISFHPESKCYVLIISYPQAPQTDEDEEKEKEKEKSRKPLVLEEKFQVKLLDPARQWTIVDSFSMSEKETVLTAKIIQLKSQDADGIKLKPFLCVGTAYTLGEDTVCKGRILIFEIVSHRELQTEETTANEDGDEEQAPKEQKGPVTALAGLCGMLIMTIGPKMIVNHFKTGVLTGVAFFDTQVFVISITTVKNYILIADMYKGVSFFRLKEGKTLVLLGKDYDPSSSVFASEFVINDKVLSIITSDLDKNLNLLSFDPTDKGSFEGKMLLHRSSYHIDASTSKFVRTPIRSSDNTTKNDKHMLLFGTLDGAIHALVPMEFNKFQFLQHLQSRLYLLPQVAGLNARAHRAKDVHVTVHNKQTPLPSILNGDLLHQYHALSREDKKLVAQSLGVTPNEIDNQLSLLSNSYNM
ncbi:hypothetical protein SAMD00019534_115940, partial [Acytostelium subglobosum LB1]|uniref:hypothetical protein n=1 Tax=Acytostelium subglobosum LB1 TaxID=1410327 RepID=UPI000644A0E4